MKRTTACSESSAMFNLEESTVYNIDYIGIFGEPGYGCK